MFATPRGRPLALVACLLIAVPARAEEEQVSSPAAESEVETEAGLGGLSHSEDADGPGSGAIFRAAASRSSFPLRLVYGKRIEDAWIQLPAAAQSPKALQRRYSANKCEFTLTAEAYGVRVLNKTDDGFAIDKEALAPQYILDASQTAPLHVSLVTDLGVAMGKDSEAHCRKLFAGKKLRFATAKLDGAVYAESRGGVRLTAAAVTEPEAVEFFITWDDRNKTLRAVDQIGLSVALETPVMALPAGRDRIFYFSCEPAWKIERVGKAMANKVVQREWQAEEQDR
jgi:hypothetical protein